MQGEVSGIDCETDSGTAAKSVGSRLPREALRSGAGAVSDLTNTKVSYWDGLESLKITFSADMGVLPGLFAGIYQVPQAADQNRGSLGRFCRIPGPGSSPSYSEDS